MKEIKDICYKYLKSAFERGLKSSPFDADNSEYHLPALDLKVAPEMTKEILGVLASPVHNQVMPGWEDADGKGKIAEIVKEIMQEGFEIAMGGSNELSEEENKTVQEKLYDKAVDKYTKIISNFSA